MSQMDNFNYVPVKRRSREQILNSLSTGSPQEIRDALMSAAYWDEDWRWAQQLLVKFADCDDDLVLWAVVASLGFIAAFHGDIDERTALPLLDNLKARPSLAGEVEETLAEIDHFVRRRKEGEDIDLAERLPEDWLPPGNRG